MLISVTTPVYNDNEGLRRSLTSLINQTYSNWEVIVVDDGSRVSAQEVINDFEDLRIKFFRFDQNQGRPLARQKTFELMNGDICAFLDAGDSYHHDFLELVATSFKKNSVITAVSQSVIVKFRDNLYISKHFEEGTFDITSEVFNRCVFAATAFRSYVCRGYSFQQGLRYSQDRHFLNYVSTNYKGRLETINSLGYLYDQGENMSVFTTIRKYYFASKRFWTERKYKSYFRTIVVGVFIFSVQILFGYRKVLSLRFKTIKNMDYNEVILRLRRSKPPMV